MSEPKKTITIYEHAMVDCAYPHVIEAENVQQALDRLDSDWDDTDSATVNWEHTETRGYSLDRMGSDGGLDVLDVYTIVRLDEDGRPLRVETYLDEATARQIRHDSPNNTMFAHRRVLIDG